MNPVSGEHHSTFERSVAVEGSVERTFDAISTVDGVRGWWATDVTGRAVVGDVMRLGFSLPNHDEWIVMRVDESTRPTVVRWTCVAQYVAPAGVSKHDEWVGTEVRFTLEPQAADRCNLVFTHAGLAPSLECYSVCANGWDHFLASLVAFVRDGAGTPFGR